MRGEKLLAGRNLLAGLIVLGASALAGCSTSGGPMSFGPSYGAVSDAGYHLPSIPTQKVPEQFRRQTVSYASKEKPGTIIVDTGERHLYFILANGKAVRYGIGVGRQGFTWHGTARIALKREWPSWTPPKEMIARKPELAKFRDGMDPGVTNPLGARAMYLGSSLYRIHGSNEPQTIGQAVSSGCIRMTNEDVVDLFDRARIGTKVVVER